MHTLKKMVLGNVRMLYINIFRMNWNVSFQNVIFILKLIFIKGKKRRKKVLNNLKMKHNIFQFEQNFLAYKPKPIDLFLFFFTTELQSWIFSGAKRFTHIPNQWSAKSAVSVFSVSAHRMDFQVYLSLLEAAGMALWLCNSCLCSVESDGRYLTLL